MRIMLRYMDQATNRVPCSSLFVSFQWNLFKIYFQIFIHFRGVSTHGHHRFHVEIVQRSRAPELMQHEPAIFHVIFIVRDDITYTFLTYFRKKYSSWTSRALEFHAPCKFSSRRDILYYTFSIEKRRWP